MLTRNNDAISALDDEPNAALSNGWQGPARAGGSASSDIQGLWLLLRWRGWLIAAVAGATLVVAGAALSVLPPKYRATAIVLVDPRQQRVTNTEAVIPGIGADAAAVESQVEIIESSPIARKVISRLNLAADPDFASSSLLDTIGDAVAGLFGGDKKALVETRSNRLEYKFQSGLTVRRRGLTYVIEIGYAVKDPAKAARIANAVADAYLDDQRAAKSDVTTRASDWLKGRIDELRERVRVSESAVSTYKAANNLVDVTQGNRLINRQIEDLTQQLALSRTRTAEAGARLERVQQTTRSTADPAALAEALQSPVIAALRSQYADAARMEAEYSSLYGNRHPSLTGVRAQVADLRRQIDREISRIVSGVRNDYQAAKDREAALEGELDRLKSQAGTLSDADVKLRELEREAQANRSLFEQFLNRAKETNEQQSLQIVEARIISPALVPLRPDRPPTSLLLIAALVGGAVLGIGLVLLLERLRGGLRSATEVQQVLSLPALGILPHAAPSKAPRAATGLLADAGSPYGDNVRAILARLQRSSEAKKGEVVAVVSALPGEGKSTFAGSLALASAAAGMRTLLIDGDPYAATITRAFEIKGPGLAEILQGKTTFWHAMTKDASTGLYILGAREVAAAQAELTEATTLAEFLRQHRPHFDFIVVDSPPLLSCDVATELVAHADRAVLVVEWERTDRNAVVDALSSLEHQAHKIVGVVLNKMSPRWLRRFESGRYARYDDYSARPQRQAA